MYAKALPQPFSWRIRIEPSVFFLSGTIIFLTFTLGSPVLNLVMPYSQPGGSFLSKFHPASWLAAPLLFLVLHRRTTLKDRSTRHLALAMGFLVILIAWLAFRGKGALAATFVDIHLTSVILLCALSRLSYERVFSLMRLFVGLAVVNVFIVMVEFAVQSRLLPNEGHELFFRPAGLFGHPIASATLSYCAMFLASRGVISGPLMRPLILFFLAGIALCGVRGPLAMGALVFFVHLVRPEIPRKSYSDLLLDFGVVALLPLGIVAGLAFGTFDRILELGLWEESAESRFTIFGALDLLTDEELWNGVGSYDASELLATQATGNGLIENAFVSTILQAGLPVALMLSLSVLTLHLPAIRRSLLFASMMALVSLTTLGFGTKNMIAPALAITGYWVWRRTKEPRPAPRRA